MASAVLVCGSNRRVHYTSSSPHCVAAAPKLPLGHKLYIELHNKITIDRYKNSMQHSQLWHVSPGFIDVVTLHLVGAVFHSAGRVKWPGHVAEDSPPSSIKV